jgi:serine protease inhibitor
MRPHLDEGNGRRPAAVLVTVNKTSLRLAAALTCATLLLAACGSPGPRGDAARIDKKLVADLRPGDTRAVGQAVDDFGFDLFGRLADGRDNTVISPLSMTVLLAMLLAGADSDTATEIAHVLHLSDRRDVRVGALLRQLSDTDEATLSVADALWAGPQITLTTDYREFLTKAFGATLNNGDLGSPATAKDIDRWASRNTDGLIDGIAHDLGLPDPTAALVLLNAVYFLGQWKTPFDPAQTRSEAFQRVGPVPMMHLSDTRFDYAQRDGYRMLRLPYGKHGRYAMEVMLPDGGHTLKDMLGTLDAAEWRSAVAALRPTEVDQVALPKFELRWKGRLNQALVQLGMPAAFRPGADFRPMSPLAPPLSLVAQKTYVRVDEKGTEAAAVSGAVTATSAKSNPLVFRVDRPFAFSISDQQTGTILFLGSVTDPRG